MRVVLGETGHRLGGRSAFEPKRHRILSDDFRHTVC